MNKKLIAPFIAWIMFLVFDMVNLVKGIAQHQSWRVTLAALALAGITGFLYYILRLNAKQLKPVRIKK